MTSPPLIRSYNRTIDTPPKGKQPEPVVLSEYNHYLTKLRINTIRGIIIDSSTPGIRSFIRYLFN